MNRTSLLLLSLGPLLMPVGMVQGSTSGFIQARLVISDACLIDSANQPPATLGNPGRLDFGAHGPRWSAPLRTQVDHASAGGGLQISCTPSVRAFSVRIDEGRNAPDGVRRLSNGRQTIAYHLTLDPGGNSHYPVGQARTFSVTSAEQIPIPIYGVVVAQPRALPAGLYRDTLRVTLDW